jgi:hypothetical protein
MKKATLVLGTICIALFSLAQSPINYKMTLGEEIKLKKGTADLDIIAADNTGLYFTEARVKVKSYFVIGATLGTSIKLMKVDKNFGEVFDKEYKKELKGLEFESFQVLGNDIYMFATDYERKGKLFKVFGAKIDKNTGDLAEDFMEIGNYPLESRKDDYEMKVSPIHNGSTLLMVSNISGKDRVSLGVHLLDKSLKRKESAVINLSFDPAYYQLQDVQIQRTTRLLYWVRNMKKHSMEKRKEKELFSSNM